MSQPEAALNIQPPTLETNVAVQITENAAWRNGATNDIVALAVEPAGGDFAITGPSGGRTVFGRTWAFSGGKHN